MPSLLLSTISKFSGPKKTSNSTQWHNGTIVCAHWHSYSWPYPTYDVGLWPKPTHKVGSKWQLTSAQRHNDKQWRQCASLHVFNGPAGTVWHRKKGTCHHLIHSKSPGGNGRWTSLWTNNWSSSPTATQPWNRRPWWSSALLKMCRFGAAWRWVDILKIA